jgi:hypothetical protein
MKKTWSWNSRVRLPLRWYINNFIATIKLENQNLNIYIRRFPENPIQISLILFERECFEVQLQKIIPENGIEISEWARVPNFEILKKKNLKSKIPLLCL